MDFEEVREKIQNCLPASFGSMDTDEYIQYVLSAFSENYANKRFQFSFLAFHLLYMCFIYKMIWQGNQLCLNGISDRIQHKCSFNPYDSPFRLSVVPEKEVIPFLNHFGFHQNQTKQFSSSVDWRDNCAHASGFIQYNKKDVDRNIEQILAYIMDIEAKNKTNMSRLFIEYFNENFKPNDPGSYFPQGFESVNNFINAYLLSYNDLLVILENNITILDESSGDLDKLYLKVFYTLLLGWYVTTKYDVAFIDIDTCIQQIQVGIEELDTVSMDELLLNELSDITSLLRKSREKSI